MEYPGHEANVWRRLWVPLCELERQPEHAILPDCAIWPKDDSPPLHDVVGIRRGIDTCGRLALDGLEVAHQALYSMAESTQDLWVVGGVQQMQGHEAGMPQ